MRRCLLLLAKRPGIQGKHGETPFIGKFGLLGEAKVRSGYSISWSKKKNRRKWYPNVHWVQLYSETMDRRIPFMVTPEVLQRIDSLGGLDAYLLQKDPKEFQGSEVAMEWRRRLQAQKRLNKTRDTIENQAQLLANWLLKMHQEGKPVLLTMPTNYGHFVPPAALKEPPLRRQMARLRGRARRLAAQDGQRFVLIERPRLRRRRRRAAARASPPPVA
eukprot:EG_transcript_29857